MSCDLIFGRILPCKDGVGGITGLYFVNFGTMTPVFDGEDTEVLTSIGTVTAYHYEIRSASNLIQTMNSSSDAGTTVIDQVITAILQRIDFKTNHELKIMAYGHPHVIVEFKDGNSYLVGLDFGASLETSTADSGTAMADLQGYTLNIVGAELSYANLLEGSELGDPFAGAGFSTVTVVNGTQCETPTSLVVTDTTATAGVDFAWTENGVATAWEYALIPIGTTLDASNDFVAAAGNPQTGVTLTTDISGATITDGIQYKVYVRSSCGGGKFSNASEAENFEATT